MSALTQLKLGLTLIGLVLFGYGVRTDTGRLRWIGIAFLAAAAALRFIGPRSSRRRRSADDAGDENR
ncbi:MAG TPA: hypothetical protein VGH98_05290 [Gemmatimonadaceae bacterium]|jgi:hypothetical protein